MFIYRKSKSVGIIEIQREMNTDGSSIRKYKLTDKTYFGVSAVKMPG